MRLRVRVRSVQFGRYHAYTLPVLDAVSCPRNAESRLVLTRRRAIQTRFARKYIFANSVCRLRIPVRQSEERPMVVYRFLHCDSAFCRAFIPDTGVDGRAESAAEQKRIGDDNQGIVRLFRAHDCRLAVLDD